MNATQRKNLLKLAAYLETLPRNYQHFDMRSFADHSGACELPMSESVFAAKAPTAFLTNCGTVACAVGHGPAAGIAPLASEFDWDKDTPRYSVFLWDTYSDRVFGVAHFTGESEYMFGAGWRHFDNHHYGAAARIRHFLETGFADEANKLLVKKYASYRKGSRSAKRREIEAAA